jgi:hypothetical protein
LAYPLKWTVSSDGTYSSRLTGLFGTIFAVPEKSGGLSCSFITLSVSSLRDCAFNHAQG